MDNVIQISLGDLITWSIPAALLVGFAGFLFKEWIGKRIDKSIQHEYDKKIEEYRFSQLQRQKAESIARFFAKWIKYRGREEKFLSRDELIDYYEELNQMSFEMILWIKDEDLLSNIMKRLQMKDDAKSIMELLCEVRMLILGNKKAFNPNEIVIWPKKTELFDEKS